MRFTSNKKVMFSSASVSQFVCLFEDYTKTTRPIFTEFGGKVAHKPRKKRLEFGDNASVHIALGLGHG